MSGNEGADLGFREQLFELHLQVLHRATICRNLKLRHQPCSAPRDREAAACALVHRDRSPAAQAELGRPPELSSSSQSCDLEEET
jgi:hypothetical protein